MKHLLPLDEEAALFETWRAAPLRALMGEILNRHHAFLRAQLPRIEAEAETLGQRLGGEERKRLRHLAELCADIRQHLASEEDSLFPYIAALETGAARHGGDPDLLESAGRIDREHDQVLDAILHIKAETTLLRLSSLSDGPAAPLQELLLQLSADLRRHIFLEDSILFPRAILLERERHL